MPLENQHFLNDFKELLFAANEHEKHKGSVYLTQKPIPESYGSGLLVRATNGKHKDRKVKLSTIVKAESMDTFFSQLSKVSKDGMTKLKKKERKEKRKKKQKDTKGQTAVAMPQ